MARSKNALRGHFIAPFNPQQATTKPAKENYKELAKWIETVDDAADEQVEETAFYDGDGTAETDVIGVKGGHEFSGMYDPEDDAQKMISAMRFKVGAERKVWYKEVSADGKKQWEGVATVTEIVAGSGEASDYEEFKCKILWNSLPTESVPSA